jgi:hypothetical protein
LDSSTRHFFGCGTPFGGGCTLIQRIRLVITTACEKFLSLSLIVELKFTQTFRSSGSVKGNFVLVELVWGKPPSAKSTTVTPIPAAHKPQLAQRSAELAGMTRAAPAASKLRLKLGKREALALDFDRDRFQEPSQPVFQRCEAFARGVCVGALLFGALGLFSFNSGRQPLDVRAHTCLLL